MLTKKNEITELCKGVHCVDLGESFQRHIFLQNFASIQPRTSPVKFARSSNAAASKSVRDGRERPGRARGAGVELGQFLRESHASLILYIVVCVDYCWLNTLL